MRCGKIVKEIATPKSESNWSLKEDSKEINGEKEIAEIFNDYFISKIQDLKIKKYCAILPI